MRHHQPEELDTSNLILLADECILDEEKTRDETIFKLFPRNKRSLRVVQGINLTVPNLDLERRDRKRPRTSHSNKKNKKNEMNEEPQQVIEMQEEPVPVEPRQVEMQEEPVPMPAWVDELAQTHLHNVQPAVRVFEKKLFASDTSKNLMRLLIPRTCLEKILFPALTEQEKGLLLHGIPVTGLDPAGRIWNLELRYWRSSNQHVLQKGWINLVKENDLKATEDTVEVFLARYQNQDQPPQEEDKLCFLIGRKQAG